MEALVKNFELFLSFCRVDKKRDKMERKVLDSQERAFWDVHRPVPGCVNTTEMDIKKLSRINRTCKKKKVRLLVLILVCAPIV